MLCEASCQVGRVAGEGGGFRIEVMAIRRSCAECMVRGAQGFCSLDGNALRGLNRIGTQVRFRERETLLAEGARPEHVYVVCEGTVKLTTSSRDGRLLLLRVAGAGDVLGLAAALKSSGYEATAVALEECEVRVISRGDFMRFMQEFDGVARNSAAAVAGEYGSAVLSARRLALSGSAAGKLASVLLDWGRLAAGRRVMAARECDVGVDQAVSALASESARGSAVMEEEDDGALRFRMPLTHEELGQMAGVSRETATRVLTQLKLERLLEVDGEMMVVRSPERLEKLYC